MTQTLALFFDAYRDLNSRKLFWVTLSISVALVLALALFGVDADGISFLRWHWDVYEPQFYYRAVILLGFVIGLWLSWGAVILALVSTAGIFPDLIAGGAIDLYLSKPMSRLRLFLTKYFTGLLFVGLQLALFCGGCFLVVGLRAHEWRPSLFLAIPLLLLLFSYIFAFCVLLGVWTRSTIAALLLGILLWLCCSGVQITEQTLHTFRTGLERTIDRTERDIRAIDARKPAGGFFDFQAGLEKKRRVTQVQKVSELRSSLGTFRLMHNIFIGLEAVVPKTRETNDLLDRWLISDNEVIDSQESLRHGGPAPFGIDYHDLADASTEVKLQSRHRSPAFILGSSLACEAIVVSLAAWIFCRRDY
ncbi:MAG: family transporter protein [Phycisphaerales bacterium]|nr:family transporter protein [Phycisphaerales bacterium]